MTTKPILVDGTDTRRAPAPKRGLQRAVYKTVEALERATEKAVYEMIPAAITKGDQVVSHKKLQRSLKNGVYRGYFITEKGIYRIAPMSYYNARQAYIDGLPKIPQGSHGHDDRESYLFDEHDSPTGITIYISQTTMFWIKFCALAITGSTLLAIGVIVGSRL